MRYQRTGTGYESKTKQATKQNKSKKTSKTERILERDRTRMTREDQQNARDRNRAEEERCVHYNARQHFV